MKPSQTKIPCISIVGRSGSGKTTLIEQLIPSLKARGARVGIIKHVAHDFEMDHPGKDTYRHFVAGADQVLIASDGKLALQKRLPRPMILPEICDAQFDDVDLILTEGRKAGPMPKIEVFRPEVHAQPVCGPDDDRIALVTDSEAAAECPVFRFGQVEALVTFILEAAGWSADS